MESSCQIVIALNFKLWFVKANAVIFYMFAFLTRWELLNKIQVLSRDMYYSKIPLAYRIVYLVPSKMPVEHHFINLIRNMVFQTHQYRGYVPFTLTQVSIESLSSRSFELKLFLTKFRAVSTNKSKDLQENYKENSLEKMTSLMAVVYSDQMMKTSNYFATSKTVIY